MKARIGIADATREIEVEVEGRIQLMESLEQAHQQDKAFLWFTDLKGNDVGIPLSRIAFIELVDEQDRSVGFSR